MCGGGGGAVAAFGFGSRRLIISLIRPSLVLLTTPSGSFIGAVSDNTQIIYIVPRR
jgi:hypothetical protein